MPLVLYNDFNVPYFLDTDPYSNTKSLQIWKAESVVNIPMGAIYIWDAHFGPNECKIPLDTVMRDPYMRLIRLIRPKKEFHTLGDYPYEVYVFRKNPVANEFDNYFLTQSFIDQEDTGFTPVVRKVFDFEKATPDVDASRITGTKAAAGRQSYLMDDKTEFSPGLYFPCKDLPFTDGRIRVKAKVRAYSDVPFISNPAVLVISLEDKKGSYCYKGIFFEKSNFVPGKWNQAYLNADLPKIKSPGDVIKVYVWHPGKAGLMIDDFIIDILASGKESR